MGQRRLTREERGLWYLEDYLGFLVAVRGARRVLRKAVRHHCGVTLEVLRDQDPQKYATQLAEMESAADRTLAGRPKWLYRFGLRLFVRGILFGPPWEVALVLVALRHQRSPRTVWNYLLECRRAVARGLTASGRPARES